MYISLNYILNVQLMFIALFKCCVLGSHVYILVLPQIEMYLYF